MQKNIAIDAPSIAVARHRNAQPNREEIAKREVGQTDITRGQAWYLLAMFMLTIFAIPVIQQASEWRQYTVATSAAKLPQVYDLFNIPPDAVDAYEQAEGSVTDRVFTANREALADIQQYEERLEDESLLTRAVLPTTQWTLTKLFGVGNEKAYVGKDEWLFYRPGIEYITGPPFLAQSQLRRRRLAAPAIAPVQPDPREAIYEFNEQLASRGIRLIIMPTPIKATIHPEKFAADYNHLGSPLQNASYQDFIAEIERRGVLVFDPTDAIMLTKHKHLKEPLYLATDTHWLPSTAELAARELARWIDERELLPASPQADYRREPKDVENLGDVAAMLRLPYWQTSFKQQPVSIQQVTRDKGELWRPSRAADVLVLGDSFSNIYSLGSMGWGESAGFIEHLSYELKRPLDRITQNDSGAYATREALSRELARGRDQLACKRLVIWQFAARELAWGDWKSLGMQLGAPAPTSFFVAPSGSELIVSGKILSISTAPRPGSVPYKDHILCAHLVDLVAESPHDTRVPLGSQAIVYLWSMRNSVREPAANYREGQPIRLRWRPWSDVSAKLAAINRSELDDESLQLEEPNWGDAIE